MAKKIYDIFHPEDESFTEKKKVTKRLSCSPVRFSGIGFKKWGILVGLFFLTTAVLGYLFFLRVDIYIWPETKAVQYEGIIEVGSDILHYSPEEGVIPGKSLVVVKEESRKFSSSGKEIEERRAEGILRVFNNHSSRPQILVARTRFISADGKLFRSTERISIPGYRQEGGRTIPGEVMVSVVADVPGEDFNIDRTTNFSIPGLFGTPMFTNIYAENPEPITGGFVGESPKITDEDVKSAREILFSATVERAIEEMKKTSPEFIFNVEDVEVSIIEEFARPGVEERYDSFEYFLKIETKVLAIKKSELEVFLKGVLLAGLEEEIMADSIFSEMRILEESLEYIYSADLKDMVNGRVSFEISATALSYPAIIEDLVKNEISGMTINEAKMTLEDHKNIKRVDIRSRPPWLENIPAPGKIRINIKIEP